MEEIALVQVIFLCQEVKMFGFRSERRRRMFEEVCTIYTVEEGS